MTDPGVHDADPSVHDEAIRVFTMHRSERSRWAETRIHHTPALLREVPQHRTKVLAELSV
jgi:hypothetical protein